MITGSSTPERSRRSRVGIAIDVYSPKPILDFIEAAEAAEVEQLWLGQVSETADALTMFAAALQRTQNVRLGMSIVPTYPLHPLALAQQAATVGTLAGGRFRLGIGPSTKSRVK